MNNHDRKTIQKMIEHCNHIIDYMKDCESIVISVLESLCSEVRME